jgi:RNA polymerase sigma factor (sigma-70 family)
MNRQKGELERNPVAAASLAIPLTEHQEQLSRLFVAHHRRVLSAAYRITGSMADAEDVAQVVFLRLSGAAGVPPENAGSYLYRAAINGALDMLRRRKATPTEALDDAANVQATRRGSLPDAEASRRELGEWLRVAISELSPRSGEMFTLRYLEELGNREIAQLMGTSQAVVAVTLHSARTKLKKRLRQLQGETR